jgi:hypothetical protein
MKFDPTQDKEATEKGQSNSHKRIKTPLSLPVTAALMTESDIQKLLFIMKAILIAQKSGISARVEKYVLLGWVVMSQILGRY